MTPRIRTVLCGRSRCASESHLSYSIYPLTIGQWKPNLNCVQHDIIERFQAKEDRSTGFPLHTFWFPDIFSLSSLSINGYSLRNWIALEPMRWHSPLDLSVQLLAIPNFFMHGLWPTLIQNLHHECRMDYSDWPVACQSSSWNLPARTSASTYAGEFGLHGRCHRNATKNWPMSGLWTTMQLAPWWMAKLIACSLTGNTN